VLNKDGSTNKESNGPDQVDAHGNWTKLTKWLTDSQGTRPVSVAYRARSPTIEHCNPHISEANLRDQSGLKPSQS